MESVHHEYYEQHKIPISTSYIPYREDEKDNGRISGIGILITSVTRLVGATAAGIMVGGPLLAGMGISVAAAVIVAMFGLPLTLIFSPVLMLAAFVMLTATAGFSLAAVIASACISALNWVFPSASTQENQGQDEEEEEEDMTAEELVEGWKRELPQNWQMKEKEGSVEFTKVDEQEEGQEEEGTARDEPQKDEDVTADATQAPTSDSDKTEQKDQSQKSSKKQKNPKKK